MDTKDYSPEQLAQIIETAQDDVRKATALKITISTEGWGILLSTFEEMKENQLNELRKQSPGDEKAILAAHAVWAATEHTIDQILSAINTTIRQGAESEAFLSADVHDLPQEDWS